MVEVGKLTPYIIDIFTKKSTIRIISYTTSYYYVQIYDIIRFVLRVNDGRAMQSKMHMIIQGVRRLGPTFAVGCGLFIGITFLVTALGAHGVLDSTSLVHTNALQTTEPKYSDDESVIAIDLPDLIDRAKKATIFTGTAVYGFNRAVAQTVQNTGSEAAHLSLATLRGIGSGAKAVAGGTVRVGKAAVRTPGNIAGAITHKATASAFIAPAVNDTASLPQIDSKTAAAEFERLSTVQREQIEKLLADQAKANERLDGSVVAGDPEHGGYPRQWDAAPQDSLVDSWGMYSRECVSYAAWKVHQTYGTMPYWGGIGNANQWVRNAQNFGIPTGKIPQVHSVAISMAGYYGHAMWVEKVNGDMIYISQYNYDLRGHYSEMWVDGRNFTYIYFRY